MGKRTRNKDVKSDQQLERWSEVWCKNNKPQNIREIFWSTIYFAHDPLNNFERAHNMQIFGEIPFVKPQNDT